MQNSNEIKVIGVTGGTGTGKSTAASIMAEFGGVVIDADEVYKELIQKGRAAYNDIVGYFGEGILTKEGEIDRDKLSAVVFNDKEKLKKLNNLAHGHVADEIHRRVNQIKKDMSQTGKNDLKFIVLDVPIPVERGFFDLVNVVFSVVANDDLRVERIMARSGITEEEAEKRIYSQMSNSEYARIADVVIENEEDVETLRKKVAEEIGKYFGYIGME